MMILLPVVVVEVIQRRPWTRRYPQMTDCLPDYRVEADSVRKLVPSLQFVRASSYSGVFDL